MARYADEDDDEPRGRGSSKKDEKKNDILEVRLENVRLSYPHIFKAQKYNGDDDPDDKGTAAYSASFIIDPKKQKDLMDLCNDAVDEALYKEWGDKPPKMKDDKFAFRNDRDEEEYDGMWYVSARSGKRPKVVDRDKSPITADDGIIYGGCYVNAIVRFWAQNNKFGKRINCSLEAVQFVRDGEAFGAPPVDTDKAFDVVEGGSKRGGGRGRSRDEEDEDRPRRGRGRDRDEEPRGRGRSRDDDEEEAPRRGRGRDRDEEEAPRRGRGRDDDEAPRRGRGRDRDEEDEAPRRSRRGEDDDEAPRRGRREL